jgi:hypothetical protein
VPELHDESDFIDPEFASARGADYSPAANTPARRPPSRQELEAQTQATQQRLEELKQVQTRLEQERVALEEARRRRTEYHTGREEMVQNLTRGVGLLEEVEFASRQQAEQTARTLADLRQHLEKVERLDDQAWTQETYAVELTRALTAIENARLQWNAARMQWPLLDKPASDGAEAEGSSPQSNSENLAGLGFWKLCRLGLALTWPITVVVLLAAAAVAVALFTRSQ